MEKQETDQENVFRDMLEINLKEIKKINENISELEEENSKEGEFNKGILMVGLVFSFIVGFIVG